MPCDYREYHPKWRLISKLIRFRRAGNRCEWCGVENGSYWQSGMHPRIRRQLCDRLIAFYTATPNLQKDRAELWTKNVLEEFGITRIVLTVAHIDRDKTNNRFHNLAALCQRCHLNHDLQQPIQNRKYGRHWKRHQLSLDL